MSKKLFTLASDFKPTGDQPKAIKSLVKGLNNGLRHQTLLGATGTGKTFTMANIINEVQRPTLILAHNKTLAAQLCAEFQQFFPNNAVSYFVSYYDYYQPEAYIARTDTYIEKEATINEEITKFRHAATVNLLTRKDVIIISSVSCIYGLGDVETYEKLALHIKRGEKYPRADFLRSLVDIQFQRVKTDFERGTFEVLGDIITIFPPNSDTAFQLEFWGDDLETITEVDGFTGSTVAVLEECTIFPAKHQVTTADVIEKATYGIEKDLDIRLKELQGMGNNLAAHRLQQRTKYDIEMLREMGYVNGIENYVSYLNKSGAGHPPATLLDYFPKDFMCFVDESHISIPQIGGMFNGNLSRKQSLIEHGFRLPSAMDNRPLKFPEFEQRVKQAIYVSATPGKYEYEQTDKENIIEQIIRPTGLLDPIIEVRPTENQVDNIMEEVTATIKKGDRVLVTTVTKKSAEDLSEYFIEQGLKSKYLHSEIETLERIQILTELRQGKIDVVVGINLLREGLDLPEVSVILILDADKQGFLRSRDSLLQIIGRAARNSHGRVVMYADKMTPAMDAAIGETNRRRTVQEDYNTKHGITPTTIKKSIVDISKDLGGKTRDFKKVSKKEDVKRMVKELDAEMNLSVENLDFERAALLRDQIMELERKL
ncbi:excinuclease ABC subunit UvrB [bacterium]|nr:excinuclease ABC subunit UvrB [bacterium]NCQ54875.1 excinuclease ABC subunit UvrB [Candidatus Parcubacteria bacterium]NCS66919.1 excinuclease ABC subunit UvrB [Candidatus Peregrinibacteria bacterium]NCS95865.1 excinuclease ABC subunit UvrB [bacterium]